MKTPNNIAELKSLHAHGEPLHFRFFLDYEPPKDGRITNACLSQWWPCIFNVGTNIYTTTEHFMMHEKAMLFDDQDVAARIIDTDHPFQAKTLGRLVRGFDEERWNRSRLDIVIRGNIAKFSQNLNLLNFLIGTGNDILAEASPTDLIWGIGCREEDPNASHPENWPGQNLLGFALMQAREYLRQEAAPRKNHQATCPNPA